MARILIVDDEPMNHELLGAHLRDAGYEVSVAADGEQALSAIAAQRPDLVLLDVQMPVKDGFATLEALRAQEALRHLPVLMLSALDLTWHKVRGLELGAEDYVTKPCAPAELLARVKGALRRAERYRDPTASMQGQLGPVRLADLLQTVEVDGRPARLVLPDLDGEVVLCAGELVAARQGRFEGAAALQRLLFLERGRFAVHSGASDPAGGGLRLSHLLMAALTEVDEVRRDLDQWAPGDPRLSLEDVSAFPALAPLVGVEGLTVTRAVAAVEGSLADAAALLRRAAQAGAVRIERGASK